VNLDDLEALAEKYRAEREPADLEIRVCMAASCQSSGAPEVFDALSGAAEAHAGCHVKPVGCMGLCSAGPLVTRVAADQETSGVFRDVRPEHATAILAGTDCAKESGTPAVTPVRCAPDMPFFTRQKKLVLANSGVIDPESFKDYVVAGGYAALVRALSEMSPTDVLREVTDSGLRGRGGGGYPTGLKWSTVAKMPAEQKYVVCNADEGDPGAFMDRAILESDPHRVLEGMAIAGYAIGADKGYVYIRAEYPLAVERLKTAIRKARRSGFLGNHIGETPFRFDIEIRLGAGAFVCGEETALMASIQGLRGQPRPRPPYPAESGLWGYPTLINNVETFANIAPIVEAGGAQFATLGTERSKGTKVFALAGRIRNTGLIEVPMGTPLREIVEDIGGGIPDGRSFKAVQTGGPSGGCLPESHLDLPVDYDSLREVGSMMGSGGMIVMDETSSMVDVARYFMEFCMTESCGKCIPCRAGTQQMHTILDQLTKGTARQSDLRLLEDLCEVVKETSLCGLGQTAPNPVLSTLRFFRQEYEDKLAAVAE
jgi:bidirectional [NiFe] hydrogenase diaphorase subunit